MYFHTYNPQWVNYSYLNTKSKTIKYDKVPTWEPLPVLWRTKCTNWIWLYTILGSLTSFVSHDDWPRQWTGSKQEQKSYNNDCLRLCQSDSRSVLPMFEKKFTKYTSMLVEEVPVACSHEKVLLQFQSI